MTTVAARLLGNGALEMASDRQATGERIERLLSPKTARYGDFYLGGAGSLTFMNRILGMQPSDWGVTHLSDISVRDIINKLRILWRDTLGDIGEGEHFSVLLASKDGIWVVDDDMSVVRYERFAAVGSGANFALGAMSAGAGVVDAVEIARDYDLYTGGEIDYFLLN